jgi:hypothetical protein
MRLVQLAKDMSSGEKNCPSVHDDLDSADFVVVGRVVDSTLVENVLLGEAAVRLNREIVLEAVRRYGLV